MRNMSGSWVRVGGLTSAHLPRLKKMMKRERGFTLLEVMVAIVLLGIVAVAIYAGLATASKSMSTADERTTAESLARTEMEYVRNQVWNSTPWDYSLPSRTTVTGFPSKWWSTANHTLPAGYDGYGVSVNATALPSHGADIEKITVTVTHTRAGSQKTVLTLVDYRSMR